MGNKLELIEKRLRHWGEIVCVCVLGRRVRLPPQCSEAKEMVATTTTAASIY